MKYIIEFKKFIAHIINNYKLILILVKNDFTRQYLGSYFGLFWAFAQPLSFIIVIWIVFSFGVRATPDLSSTPFFLWLITGMIPWFFLSSGLMSGSNSVVSNAYLVKKVAFRVSILPLIKIGSGLIIHIILLVVLILVFLLYGFTPNLYWIQILYYLFCSIFILVGLSWITSSIRVFVKDVGNFISVLIQIGFWATPIFWNINKVPEKYQYFVKLSPASYIVNGYRDTFINHIWFWEKSFDTLYFIGLSLLLFLIGAIIFKRLRPHFGDVL